MSCFAKWSDQTWCNGEINAVTEDGVYTVMFVDYSYSDGVIEENVAVNLDEIPTGDNIDQFVENNNFETLVVNGRTVTVKSGQHAKTILCIFCQQNQLNFPQYILTRGKQRCTRNRMEALPCQVQIGWSKRCW